MEKRSAFGFASCSLIAYGICYLYTSIRSPQTSDRALRANGRGSGISSNVPLRNYALRQ